MNGEGYCKIMVPVCRSGVTDKYVTSWNSVDSEQTRGVGGFGQNGGSMYVPYLFRS